MQYFNSNSKDIVKLTMFESQKKYVHSLMKSEEGEKGYGLKTNATGIVALLKALNKERHGLVTRRRVRDHRVHLASRSVAQRERVLGHRKGRLASETPDQRTSRLELGRA